MLWHSLIIHINSNIILIINWHDFEQTLGDSEWQEGLLCYHSWGCKELITTEQQQKSYNITTVINIIIYYDTILHVRLLIWK